MLWWWMSALWIAESTAVQNCPLDCRCLQPMEIDCSGSGRLTLDPSIFSGQGVRQTRRLYLHENRLTTVDRDLLAWLGQLRILTLHDNLLMSLNPEVFSGQRNLETLTLYNNALVVLPPCIFASMIALKVLSLASNRLNVIHPEQFANNILLESLDLSKNELHSLPVDFLTSNIRLKELLLNDNMLKTVAQECFVPVMGSLKVIDLSDNHWLRPPALPEFKDLDLLRMSRCNITYILHLPKSLARLDLSFNLLEEVPENLPSNLQEFNIAGNHLRTFPDVELFPETLQNLSLSHNKFRNVSYIPSSIQFLWLDYIGVRSPLNESIFADAKQLRYLNLEGNQLTSPLGRNVFKSQSKLKTLVLTGNCLTTLDVKDFVPLKEIHVVNISKNPLRCDCGVNSFHDWARRKKVIVVPQICNGQHWDEPLGKLDCSPATTTATVTTTTHISTTGSTTTTTTTRTTTTSITSIRRPTSSTTTAMAVTVAKPEELDLQPSVGQLMLNQTTYSSAPRMKVCCMFVIIAVISVEVT